MKNILENIFYHNSLQSWMISIALVILSFVISKVVFWVFKKWVVRITDKTKTQLDDIFMSSLERPLLFIVILAGIHFSIKRLVLPDAVMATSFKVFLCLGIFAITWFVSSFSVKFVDLYIRPLVESTENDLDDHILPIIVKGLRIGIWIIGIIVALNNAGIDVGALLAGMGIGGLAIAMAAKDTLSNFFGGVTILTDRPFKIGDRIKVAGHDGYIDSIGIRSSRLRTLEGRIVTIPNSKFSDSVVENVTKEPSRKVKLNLGLTYDTTPEQMQKAMDILQSVLDNDDLTEEEIYLGFNSFGDFSLGILLIYYIKKDSGILEAQTKVNMEILKQFNENNLSFAFPTQTIELQKD